MTDPVDLPLAGVTVADFSRVLAGPLCTMVLADLGADIIKIERPGSGDDTRSWGPPFVDGDAAYFFSVNRSKRSVSLDLTNSDDLDVAFAIISRADVLVENFRSGVMDSFGLGYKDVSKTNRGLIYCSIPAFSFPPAAGVAGYDLLMQALSGFMSVTGESEGQPVKMGVAILDIVTGLFSAVGVLAALRAREISGRGRRISVGLFEASVAALANQASNYLLGNLVPTAAGTAHPNIVPYQMFHSDQGQFVLAVGNDKLFRAACRVADLPDLADDDRYRTNADRVANRDELINTLEDVFVTKGTDHWVARFSAAGVPAAPVRTLDEVFASPEGEATVATLDDPVRGLLQLVRSPLEGIGEDVTGYRPPPRLGEHDDEIRLWANEDKGGDAL